VNRLDGKKQGKPLLLGHKLDLERIVVMRERRAPIGSSTVIGNGMEFLMRDKKPDKKAMSHNLPLVNTGLLLFCNERILLREEPIQSPKFCLQTSV